MSEEIGYAAGQVWGFLKSNGPATADQIRKGIRADSALTNQALGWLAREGKLRIDRSKRLTTFELIE